MAVLCNVSTGNAVQYAQTVAEMYLGDAIKGTNSSPSSRPERPESGFTADAKDLTAYGGSYHSDEAEVTYDVVPDGDSVLIKRRPDTSVRLRPTGRDEFDGPAGRIRFIRSESGEVTEMSLRGSRVFDLRFRRQQDTGR